MSSIPTDPMPAANVISFNIPYGDLSSKVTRIYHFTLEISLWPYLAIKYSSLDSRIDTDIDTALWKESTGVAMSYLH